ncbi:LytR C-terminal domain-containing protein [Patescibacteria group bacterium]|nr:LytR C-terminal domain-containing protein [Patescibacteria group bacterium]
MKRAPAQRKNKSRSKTVVNRSIRKKIYKFGLMFGVFSISFAFLFSYTFYKYLNQRFASALSNTSYAISDDDIPTVTYIVAEDLDSDPVIIKKVNFIIFNKQNKKVSIYDVPVDIDLALPGKYGSEVLGKVFALGGLNSDEKIISGVEAIDRSIFKLFGFKVDKFVLTEQEHDDFFNTLWHEGGVINLANIKSITNLGGSFRTDMDLREFYSLLSFVYSLPKDRVVDETNVPNCFCNTQYFDNYIREYTYESPVAKEQKNIAVLNGTNYSGLASFASRVITNFGGRIVATKSTSKLYDESIIISDDINSQTTAFISRVFKISRIISKDETSDFLENEVDRSDVVVIFGFDISNDLY